MLNIPHKKFLVVAHSSRLHNFNGNWKLIDHFLKCLNNTKSDLRMTEETCSREIRNGSLEICFNSVEDYTIIHNGGKYSISPNEPYIKRLQNE